MVRFELCDQILVPGDRPGGRHLPVGMAVADAVRGHEVPQRQHGQLAAGVREVLPGERQECGHPRQLGRESGGFLPPEREVVEGEPLHGVHVGSGIPRPGAAHPEVEVEAVQPRPDQQVVHLLRDWPARRINRSQAVREAVEPGALPLDGFRAVVRETVLHGRTVELEEFTVEGDQRFVVAGAAGHAAGGDRDGEREDEDGSPLHRELSNVHGEPAALTRWRRKATKSRGGWVPASRAATRCRQAPS